MQKLGFLSFLSAFKLWTSLVFSEQTHTIIQNHITRTKAGIITFGIRGYGRLVISPKNIENFLKWYQED